jgi:5'-nucleotidase
VKILLTNDDGIFAPGLAAIYKHLVRLGQVTVVAPDASRSGASHSVTFSRPLVCNKVDINGQFTGYSVEGSPADCVKLAVMELHDGPIDLLVSGINNGANAGINVYYSGTVAAAMEGAFLNIAAVALSLCVEAPHVPGDFEKAAEYCAAVIQKLIPIKPGGVINVNIPQLSKGPPKGIKVARHASTGFDESFVRHTTELGQTVFQLIGDRHVNDGTPTDISLLEDGYITITALSQDMTNHRKTSQLQQKLDGPLP